MAASIEDFDIAIVGGGIVGLAAACLLSKCFERVALIDNSSFTAWKKQDAYGLRVSAINLASSQLLSDIGVWESVLNMRAFPYDAMHVWEGNSDTQITFSSNETSHPSLGTIVENDVLLTALNEKIKEISSIKKYHFSLQDISEISDTAMLLELENNMRLSAKLVVGADGQHSKVRESMGASAMRTHYQQLGLVACVKTEEDHGHIARQCFTHNGPLALLPMADKVCSIVWSVSEQRNLELLELSEDEFNQQLTTAFEKKLGKLELISERKSFPLLGAQSSQYVSHRTVLLGDAAHVIHPLAGLGLNMGLADARYLGELLSKSDRALGSERVLRQYERARKSENILMQRSLETIDSLFREEHQVVKKLRNIGVNMTNKTLPLKLFFMRRALGVPI